MTMLTLERLKAVLSYNQNDGIFRWKITKTGWRGAIISMPGEMAGYKNRDGYWNIIIDKRLYLAHRLAWFYVKGVWPMIVIDHIDGDRSNNCWSNLRAANYSQNTANSKKSKSNTSGFKGVHRAGAKWRFTISSCDFNTPQEAHVGYMRVARFLHAEYANGGGGLTPDEISVDHGSHVASDVPD